MKLEEYLSDTLFEHTPTTVIVKDAKGQVLDIYHDCTITEISNGDILCDKNDATDKEVKITFELLPKTYSSDN